MRQQYAVTRASFLILFLISSLCIFSQNTPVKRIDFNGTLIDAETGAPIEFATIQIPDHALWAISDMDGKFKIPGMKPGVYTCEISVLGYQKTIKKIEIKPEMKLTVIKLSPMTLALNEVVVTAQEQRMGSASKIDQSAIQHIQPKSVEDMLQLLPGNLTKNPDLNNVGQAYIREVSSNDNNALGTSVMVDGAPLSNDANMQVLSTSKSGTSLNAQSVSGKGLDLRTISPDNIESMEVIRGIPSVEYGNLTSGAVIIKTRSGVTPLEVKLKADPFSKMAYAGKGFLISEKMGAMNISADYSQSYADIRKRYNGFDRITANLGYSNTFMKSSRPLTFNMRLAYYQNINSEKSDPQLKQDEKIKNENMGVRFNLEGNWRLNTSWISSLGYSFMVNYSHQQDYRREQIILQSGITPVANSYVSGEYQTYFLNSSYYSDYTVDGKPLDVFGQLKANKLFQFSSDCFMTLKAGIEWKYNVNRGDGMMFDPKLPPVVNDIQSIRPRSFKSVPAINTLSFFIEDKAQLPIRKTTLTLQGGVRLSNLFIDKSAGRKDMFMVEPRINMEYNILNGDNNKVFDDLSIVGGFGIAAKAPTLLYLYPDKAYFDESSFNLMFADDMSKSTSIMTTKVIDNTSNPDLKPAYSQKMEIGLAGRIRKVTGNVTFFYEKHTNEYSFKGVPVTMPFRRYSVPGYVDNVNYTNGMLYYEKDGIRNPATIVNDTTLYSYNMPVNNTRTIKRGVEYSINFGQIPLLKTSVVVDGAWLYVKRHSTLPTYSKIGSSYEGKLYPYMAVMPGGGGSIEQRFNTNVRFITHIPKLKMIFSTTAQIVWKESYQRIYEDESGNNLFYKAVDPLSGNNEEKYFVNPIGFIDKQGNFNEWKAEYQDIYKYRLMMTQYGHSNYFGIENYPTTILLNFRLTKELGKMLELSFTANNFLKISKSYKYRTAAGYKDLTIPIYFGAEVKIKI